MVSELDTLHLLMLMESPNDAESIISLLRNSGSSTRAHLVTSIDDFYHQLQQKTWDLVISERTVGDIHFKDLQTQIRRVNKDLPVILVAPDVDPMIMEDALKRGASTIVPIDESNLLVLAIQREITHLRNRRERRSLEVRLRDAEKRCQSLLESARDAVAYIHDGMHLFANSAYLKLFGYQSVAELEGMPIMDMVGQGGQQQFKSFLKTYMTNNEASDELETTGVDGEGNAFPMKMSFSPATYSDERCTQVIIRAKEQGGDLEEKLREMSNLDMMTGLHNKPYFMAQLEKAVDRAVLNGAKGAVMYINIDGFGRVKSQVGIALADTVLTEVGMSLKKLLGSGHNLSRISEDIFSCILMDVDANSAVAEGEKIRQHIENLMIDLNDRTITVTASIGISLITDSSARPEDVLQQSHTAADQVRKQDGHEKGNGVMLYVNQDLEKGGKADVKMDDVLTDALRNNSFQLLFQPLISLRGEEVEHYESLLRLEMPDGEEISGGDFMNRHGINDILKRKIDRWVILNTVKALGEHRAKGHNTRVFITVSAPSLLDETLPGWIGVAIRAARLPKGSVIVQFYEDDATRMIKQVQDFTNSLEEKGIPTAINRFGCALDPFKALQHLKVDYVKIDGSYTREMDSNKETMDNLKKMLNQLHEDDKKTIIPQVESASSLASLWQLGVHFIQGYYVQAPQKGMNYNFQEENSV